MKGIVIKNVAVIDQDGEEYYGLESKREEILDNDYAQTAIIIGNEIIYWDDNIHGNPDDYYAGLIKGMEVSKVPFEVQEIVMYEKDLRKMNGVKY